jgi:hypothetical protein
MEKEKKRRIFALVVLGLVLVGYGAFTWKMMQNPEVQQRQLHLIRDTPANIFYPVAIGILVLVTGPLLWILINQKRWSRMATVGSIENAKKIARSLWRVSGPVLLKDDAAVMRFRHFSFGRWSFILPVRCGHPDIEQFRQLKDGDIVEFEPLSAGMECALEHELCGFLRIKSISDTADQPGGD